MKKISSKIILTAAALTVAAIMPAQNPAPAAPVTAVPAAPAKPAITLEQILAPLPDVLAEAGKYKVTKAELLARLKDMDGAAEILGQMPENIRTIQLRKVVENMITEQLYLELAAKAGFKADKAWAKQTLLKNFSEMPKEQQEYLKQQLAAEKKTLDQFIDENLKNETQVKYIAIGAFMDDKFNSTLAKISDAAVDKFYNDNKEKEFKQPAMVRVAHVLITPMDDMQKLMTSGATPEQWAAAEKKANAALERIKKGEDFAKVAAELSACPSGKQGKGELPAFAADGSMVGGQGKMDGIFTKAAFALAKAGDVSAPVKTMFGYHIIKLLEKTQDGYIQMDDNMKKQIKQYLAQESVGKELDAQRAALNIKVHGLDVVAQPAAPAPVAPAPAAK